LGGIASACLPESIVPMTDALISSIASFAITHLIRLMANAGSDEERMGLGDVYLMAGLCAWLPWQIACYAAAGGLVICCGCALLTRKPSKPFAPALFSFMSAISIFFPHILPGVL
jgi:leader peptidase (prepilin peptidase)/N-methyltransferase